MVVATEVRCDRSRLIGDSHAELPQVVAAALAFAFAGLPTKADALDGGAAKERRSHGDVPAPLTVMRLAPVIRRQSTKQGLATKLLDERRHAVLT